MFLLKIIYRSIESLINMRKDIEIHFVQFRLIEYFCNFIFDIAKYLKLFFLLIFDYNIYVIKRISSNYAIFYIYSNSIYLNSKVGERFICNQSNYSAPTLI